MVSIRQNLTDRQLPPELSKLNVGHMIAVHAVDPGKAMHFKFP